MRSVDELAPARLAALAAARRVLNVCTVCGYCDGLCEVFPAAQGAGELDDATVVRLSHLCHACRSCAPACQYASPHPFAIDVPMALSRVREGSWRRRPGLALMPVAAVPVAVAMATPAEVLFAPHLGAGAFERIVPLTATIVAALAALARPTWVFGREIAGSFRHLPKGDRLAGLAEAVRRIAVFRDLDGGGGGCGEDGERLGRLRRWSHLAVLHGFLACFAATVVGAFDRHVLGLVAPHALSSLPVVLGMGGGVALAAGTLGMIVAKARTDPKLDVAARDFTLPVVLFLVAASGLALLACRETAAMGTVLALHLGLVLGFFSSAADGRFAHAPLRAMAMWHAAIERRMRGARGRAALRRGRAFGPAAARADASSDADTGLPEGP
ncbi:MAG: tricarballylate utilization 4Fe-4S protein TcuB [Phyllobacteriaceae bacterium]|nr:tricarballylate utilization 4Fe-4S protein TcuB [Phyllobacteriaceae bacterium]